jgi:hypothetical protein
MALVLNLRELLKSELTYLLIILVGYNLEGMGLAFAKVLGHQELRFFGISVEPGVPGATHQIL